MAVGVVVFLPESRRRPRAQRRYGSREGPLAEARRPQSQAQCQMVEHTQAHTLQPAFDALRKGGAAGGNEGEPTPTVPSEQEPVREDDPSLARL